MQMQAHKMIMEYTKTMDRQRVGWHVSCRLNLYVMIMQGRHDHEWQQPAMAHEPMCWVISTDLEGTCSFSSLAQCFVL